MRTLIPLIAMFTVLGSALLARADDELLRGPYPFIKNDDVTVHAGYSAGFGDTPRGLRVQGDYYYRLSQSVWLDLQMAVVSGSCRFHRATCPNGRSTAIDIAAGAAWRFQTNLPLVPYTKIDAGPLFLFPQGVRSAVGILIRGGLGAHYYFFDWLGAGAEITCAGGVAFFGFADHDRSTVGDVSATVGLALQF